MTDPYRSKREEASELATEFEITAERTFDLIIREEPCGDESPHEAHVFSYGPMHYQCPGESGRESGGCKPSPEVEREPVSDAGSAPDSSAATTCPVCAGKRTPIFWTKAGMTSRLCDAHKQAARRYRRVYG